MGGGGNPPPTMNFHSYKHPGALVHILNRSNLTALWHLALNNIFRLHFQGWLVTFFCSCILVGFRDMSGGGRNSAPKPTEIVHLCSRHCRKLWGIISESKIRARMQNYLLRQWECDQTRSPWKIIFKELISLFFFLSINSTPTLLWRNREAGFSPFYVTASQRLVEDYNWISLSSSLLQGQSQLALSTLSWRTYCLALPSSKEVMLFVHLFSKLGYLELKGGLQIWPYRCNHQWNDYFSRLEY